MKNVYLNFKSFRSYIEKDLDPIMVSSNENCSGWLSQLFGMWKIHLNEFGYTAESIYTKPVKIDVCYKNEKQSEYDDCVPF